MPTEKTTTVHGEIEYETVECSSCGNEIPKAEATPFAIGEFEDTPEWATHRFKRRHVTMGWACDFCREDPVGFPVASRLPSPPPLKAEVWFLLLVFAVLVVGIAIATAL